MELYQAKDHHGVELGLGITGTGISVFKGRIVITTFAWCVRSLFTERLSNVLLCCSVCVYRSMLNFVLSLSLSRLHIQKITYKRKRFYIELRPDQVC